MLADVLSLWKASLETGLRVLEVRGQRRTLAEVRGVNLCSNDYLGLAESPALREALVQAVAAARRVGGTGSRLLSGQTAEWSIVEEEFASFVGTEAALFFASGYAANMGTLAALLGRDDVAYSDALNHSSLIDGMRLSGARIVIYPHLDLNVLEASLRQDAGAPGRKVIVTESIFSMDGDAAPLEQMAGLADRYGATLIVDEAHSTGVHGPAGRGRAVQEGILPFVLASIHTCSKALGSAGAFVCGPRVLKDHLINHARTFIFSTALPPYFAAQISTALHLAQGMEEERRELLGRAARFGHRLRCDGFDTAGSASQIVPVVLGSNELALGAAAHLQQDGFAVRAIRPPTVPAGRARLRFSLTTGVGEEELMRLAGSLGIWRRLHAVPATAGRI